MNKIKPMFSFKICSVVDKYANEFGLPVNDCLKNFLASTTFKCLMDLETGLVYEPMLAVYDQWLEELGHDT